MKGSLKNEIRFWLLPFLDVIASLDLGCESAWILFRQIMITLQNVECILNACSQCKQKWTQNEKENEKENEKKLGANDR